MSFSETKVPFDQIVITSPDKKAAEAALCGPLTKISCSSPTTTIVSTCDPMNTRMGSGGGTIAALDQVTSSKEEETVLIIHAGGESSRCPTQMSLGKAWTTIPCNLDKMENPTSLLISTLSHLLQNIPNGSVIVAASDVLLSFQDADNNNNDNNSQSNPICFETVKDQNVVLGIAVPAPLSTATNHGVFVFNKDNNHVDNNEKKTKVQSISHFLQKPSIQEMKQNGHNDSAWIDTGVVIFLPKAAKMLRYMAQNKLAMCTQRGIESLYDSQKQDRPKETRNYDTQDTTSPKSKRMKLSSNSDTTNETDNSNHEYLLETFAKESALRIELYSHFMLALSTDGDKQNKLDNSKRRTAYINHHLSEKKNEPNSELLECIYENFSQFELKACTVPNGKFIHLGTSAELMEFMIHGTIQDANNTSEMHHPNLKCYEFGQRIGLSKRSQTLLNFLDCADSSVVCNTIITNMHSNKYGTNCKPRHIIEKMSVVEHCALMVLPPHNNNFSKPQNDDSETDHSQLKIGSNCLISGMRGCVKGNVTIPSNMCLQMLPLKIDWQRSHTLKKEECFSNDRSYYVNMYLSVLDNVKKCDTIYGIPLSDFCKYGQISRDDVWDMSHINESQCTLWNAKLHPVITFSRNNDENSFDEFDFQWDHLEWVGLLKVRVETSDPNRSEKEEESLQKWKLLPRLSLSEIRSVADALKEFQYRDRISNDWLPFHTQLTNSRVILEKRQHISFDKELYNYCKIRNSTTVPYHRNENLRWVFHTMQDIVCMNVNEQKYDICSRSFMVLAALLYDLAQVDIRSSELKQNGTIDVNLEEVKQIIDKIRFLSTDNVSRANACAKLFSMWSQVLLGQGTPNQYPLSASLQSCVNQMEEAASALTDLCCRSTSIENSVPFGKWVIATAPARIDLSGGWSDTPPISYEFGGAVACLAVMVSKKKPLLCRCRKVFGQKGIILSTETRDIVTGILKHENRITLNRISDFLDFRDPNAACSLLKCALIYLGLVSLEDIFESKDNGKSKSLQDRLKKFCATKEDVGLEVISTSLLPRGSGMGSSSILSGCVLSSIASCVGIDITGRRIEAKNNNNEKTFSEADLTQAVLAVEQLLTTGGGWQDQIGGLIGGLKLGRSQKNKVPLEISVERGIIKDDVVKALNKRLHLVYTGTPRLAKNILQNVLRRWSRRSPDIVATVENLVNGATDAYNAVESGDISKVGDLMSSYWKYKKIMAGQSSEPDSVRNALKVLKEEELIIGGTLVGAGGGGFMVLLSKDEGISSEKLKHALAKVDNPLSNLATWHECTVSIDGLRVWTVTESVSNEKYDLSWHN